MQLTKESTTNSKTGLANMPNANDDIVAEILAEMRDSQAPSPLSPIKSPEKQTLSDSDRHTFLTTSPQTPKNRWLQSAEEQNCFPRNKTCQTPKIPDHLKRICHQKLLSSWSPIPATALSKTRRTIHCRIGKAKEILQTRKGQGNTNLWICQKPEQDVLQQLIRQQQKNSSTDTETISSLKQQLSQMFPDQSMREKAENRRQSATNRSLTRTNLSQKRPWQVVESSQRKRTNRALSKLNLMN